MTMKIPSAVCKSRNRSKLEAIALAGLLTSTLAGFAQPARATTLFNGNFTSTAGTLGTAGGGLNTLQSNGVSGDYTTGGSLNSWTIQDVGSSSGLAFVYYAGNQGSTTTNGDGVNLNGRFGNFSVYDPGNIAGATPSGGAIPNASPGGGNSIAADGASGYQVAIYQTLTSLNPGSIYAVTFWYAAAQQYSFSGTTTEGWQVSLENAAQVTQVAANGTTIQDTPAQPGAGLAQGSFQAWAQQTFNFTATSSTEVLTFLSLGTPSGQPPVDFLSDVQLSPTATPEPAALGMFGLGLVSLAALRMRRNRLRKSGAACVTR
jgi:hypothetical protein